MRIDRYGSGSALGSDGTDVSSSALRIEAMFGDRLRDERSLGIDHVLLTPLQVAKIFSIGLPSGDWQALQDEFGKWRLPHLAKHARVLSENCANELLPGTPFCVWPSQLDAPHEPWSSYGFVGLTVDLSGILRGGFPGYQVATHGGTDSCTSLLALEWIERQWDEIVDISLSTWGDNDRAAETLHLLDRAIPEAVGRGELELSLAPLVLAVRLCLCQFTEIGSDVLRSRGQKVAPLIPIETSSTLPDFLEQDSVNRVIRRAKRLRIAGRE